MKGCRSIAAVAATAWLLTAASAQACAVYQPPRPADAREAEAVVIGTVRRLERAPSRRVRITVEVDRVISGRAPRTITVDWFSMMNNGPPETMSGGYLFALQKTSPSMSEGGDPADFAVLQGVCSGALVFRRGSPEANAVREMFGLWPEPPPEPVAASLPAPMERGRRSPIPWAVLTMCGVVGIGAALIGWIVLRPRRRRPPA